MLYFIGGGGLINSQFLINYTRKMFRVLERPIEYLLDNYKEKLKLAMKHIIKGIICSVISIL